jgi:hypothetical protein
MSPMKRRLLNLLTALSLLMCLGVVVLWARSLSVADSFVTDHFFISSVEAAVRVKHYGNAANFFGADRRRWRSDPADQLEHTFWPLPGRRGSFSFAGAVSGTTCCAGGSAPPAATTSAPRPAAARSAGR